MFSYVQVSSKFGSNMLEHLSLTNAMLHVIHPYLQIYHVIVSTALHQYAPFPLRHNVAAASTAPAILNVALFVILTSTGYIHSMYFAQPVMKHNPSILYFQAAYG